VKKLGPGTKGFVWRFVVAIALTGLAFWLAVSESAPRVLGMPAGIRLWRVIEAPVAALNFMLPDSLKTAPASTSHFQCFPSMRRFELLRYLAIGVTAYVLLLYFPVAAAMFWRHRKDLWAGYGV